MPRPAFANVSAAQLVAELQKRKARLANLVKQRDALTSQIEELQSLKSPAAEAAPIQTRKIARDVLSATMPKPAMFPIQRPWASRRSHRAVPTLVVRRGRWAWSYRRSHGHTLPVFPPDDKLLK
jgi:hypothetical protein